MIFHLLSERTVHGEIAPYPTEPVPVDRRPACGPGASPDEAFGEDRLGGDRPGSGAVLFPREGMAGQADAAHGGTHDPEAPVRPLGRSSGVGTS